MLFVIYYYDGYDFWANKNGHLYVLKNLLFAQYIFRQFANWWFYKYNISLIQPPTSSKLSRSYNWILYFFDTNLRASSIKTAWVRSPRELSKHFVSFMSPWRSDYIFSPIGCFVFSRWTCFFQRKENWLLIAHYTALRIFIIRHLPHFFCFRRHHVWSYGLRCGCGNFRVFQQFTKFLTPPLLIGRAFISSPQPPSKPTHF